MVVRLGGGNADIMAIMPMLGVPAIPGPVRLFGPTAPTAASPGIPIPTERRKRIKLVSALCSDQKISSARCKGG